MLILVYNMIIFKNSYKILNSVLINNKFYIKIYVNKLNQKNIVNLNISQMDLIIHKNSYIIYKVKQY